MRSVLITKKRCSLDDGQTVKGVIGKCFVVLH